MRFFQKNVLIAESGQPGRFLEIGNFIFSSVNDIIRGMRLRKLFDHLKLCR